MHIRYKSFLVFYIFLLIFLNNYCKTYEVDIEKTLNERIQDPMIDTKDLPIYVITNRFTTNQNKECSNNYFKNNPSYVKYIICNVNVPREHKIGALDTIKDNIKEKDIYFYSSSFQEIDKKYFFDNLKDQKEILIFVHGFNVEFEESIYRIAQIHYDLKFQGISIVYSWPAGPKEGFLSNLLINDTYSINQNHAKISVPIFKEFIKELLLKINKDSKIYLIVHSMGHQIVIPSLVEIVKENTFNKKFKDIIFNAPDYPIQDFIENSKYLKQIANRITIYCSPKDNALVASETVNKNRRVGQCYKIDGIDVINVQRVDSPILGIGGLGHGYYSSRSILTDLYQLTLGIEAKKRLFIIKSNRSTEDYILRD